MHNRLMRRAASLLWGSWTSDSRTPWWVSSPPLLLFLVVFSTWDDAATSLFLGAIVPVHVMTAAVLLTWCPANRLSLAAVATRMSLLVPALLTTIT